MDLLKSFRKQKNEQERAPEDFVAWICQRSPEQAREKLAELETYKGIGFDVQEKYTALEKALKSLGERVLLGRLTEIGYDMELPPISPYENSHPHGDITRYVAFPLPEKSTKEKRLYLGQNAYISEDLPFFAYLTEWILFSAEEMPLRKNERSLDNDFRSTYEVLQEYRRHLSQQEDNTP